MEYRIFISIVDISENLTDIDVEKDILENIDIDINIDKEIWENIDIVIDIDKKILENIDIDKISNRLEFGISNRASDGAHWRASKAPNLWQAFLSPTLLPVESLHCRAAAACEQVTVHSNCQQCTTGGSPSNINRAAGSGENLEPHKSVTALTLQAKCVLILASPPVGQMRLLSFRGCSRWCFLILFPCWNRIFRILWIWAGLTRSSFCIFCEIFYIFVNTHCMKFFLLPIFKAPTKRTLTETDSIYSGRQANLHLWGSSHCVPLHSDGPEDTS